METSNPVTTAPLAPAKIRHEWYQTNEAVFVSFLAKGLSKERVSVVSALRKLDVDMTFSEDEKRTVSLDLLRSVIVEDTTFKVSPSKVEVILKKTEPSRWETLERPLDGKAGPKEPSATSYPTSSKQKYNWDELELEVTVEEAEDEKKKKANAMLKEVFTDLYNRASDNERKAMTISFSESGGTIMVPKKGKEGQ